jgi:hypothetical protein
MSTLFKSILNKNFVRNFLKTKNLATSAFTHKVGLAPKQKPLVFHSLFRQNYSKSTFDIISRDFNSRPLTKDYIPVEDDLSFSPRSHKNEANKTVYTSGCEFSSFKIPAKLLNRLKELGYDQPFPIQAETLKYTLEGR